jgi:FAD synthetase
VLILFLCALARLETPLPRALQTVYVATPEGLAEVDSFVSESVAAYRLDLTRYALPKKDAFREYLEERTKVKVILAGTIRSDPHGQTLTHFDETEPAFTRVHPIIDWNRDEIWAVSSLDVCMKKSKADILQFIQHFHIPYCSFYGQSKSPGGINGMSPGSPLTAGSNDHDHVYGSPVY